MEEEKKIENEEQGTEEKAERDLSEELNEMISKHVVAILNSEDISKLLPEIKSVPKEELHTLCKIIAIAMANSSFGSIVIYDNMLKDALEAQFENTINFINNLRADLDGVIEAMKIHQKKIGILENKELASEIKKEN